MQNFSKSKLMALRQCEKRFWLELHHPELREDSAATQRSFQVGHQVGDVARKVFDPQQCGVMIDLTAEGYDAAFARSAVLLTQNQPVFEAGFTGGDGLAFADVMLPEISNGQLVWRMIEVKSSASVKDYYREDIAVQIYVAKQAGVPVGSVWLAHIDTAWTYPGDDDYQGLFKLNELTQDALSRQADVGVWIKRAQQLAGQTEEPVIATGDQCDSPFACGFIAYCTRNDKVSEFPIRWLPRLSAEKRKQLTVQGINDLRQVPDTLLNATQRRVKECTSDNTVYFDAAGAAADLVPYCLPVQFLDFETIQFPIPIWKGTRPYQQIPFQFSLHTLSESSELAHEAFLDLSGNDPSEAFAQQLIACCGKATGAVFVYNAGFESARIRELAERFSQYRSALLAINERLVDLLPIARERYYHPSQQGSWSIKAVLPAAVPELDYSQLDGVQDGTMAMNTYLEALRPETTTERRQEIEQQLLAYCKMDTYAMVRLWQAFAGRNVPI